MNPKPPLLDSGHTQAFSDGELFWIVKNGIRASGMPGFGLPSPGRWILPAGGPLT
jgi:hypothetical protein